MGGCFGGRFVLPRRDFQIRFFAVFNLLLIGKGSLLEYVKDKNLNRRQLSESQKGMIAARMKPMYEAEARERQKLTQLVGRGVQEKDSMVGTRGDAPLKTGRSAEIVGAMVGVSRGTVNRASKVLKNGVDELVSAVDSGNVSVRAAAEISEKPKSEQPTALAEYRAKKFDPESLFIMCFTVTFKPHQYRGLPRRENP